MEEYKTYIEKELERVERSEKVTWIVGGGIAAFVLIYMSVISYQVTTQLYDAERWSIALTGMIDRAAPDAIRDAEKSLIANSTHNVELMHEQVLTLLEVSDQFIREQVDNAPQVIRALEKEIEPVTSEFYRTHKDTLRVMFESGQQQKAADDFAKLVYDAFVEAINKRVVIEIDGKQYGGVTAVNLAKIREYSKYIRKLSRKHPRALSPSERLQRRLIVAMTSPLRKELRLMAKKG